MALVKLSELIISSHNTIKQVIIDSVPQGKKELDLSLEYYYSTRTMGNYVTLDDSHVNEIRDLRREIRKYAKDTTLKRPLNILMFASPGSGKSHFVKCLAESIQYVSIGSVTYNMANMQNLDELIQPLESGRNLKVADKLPIIFLDEFDSDPRNYAYLLPLLWEGELRISNRDIKMGKIIIILAASKADMSEIVNNAKNLKFDTDKLAGGKLIDLISRINGGAIEIPNLEYRKVDKVCLAISLIKRRFEDRLCLIPWALLRLIAKTEFRYGVRSITHLIDLIPNVKPPKANQGLKKILRLDEIGLPLQTQAEFNNSSLAYHIIAKTKYEHPCYIWGEASKKDTLVRIKSVEEELMDEEE